MSIRIINGKVYKNGTFSEEDLVLKEVQGVLALLAEMRADNIGGVSHPHIERACWDFLGCFCGCSVFCHSIPPV